VGSLHCAAIDVLFVCTGNINRSPMGAALLQMHLRARRADAVATSVGTHATLGPSPREVIELLAERGLDVHGHRSRQVTPELLAEADLIIGMAREHVRETVLLGPGTFGRTFTLKELVRRAREVGGRRPAEPLENWLAGVGEGRTTSALLGASDADDVADPIGKKLPAFRRCADEIDALTSELSRLVVPAAVTAP